jgi:hypothetical protein
VEFALYEDDKFQVVGRRWCQSWPPAVYLHRPRTLYYLLVYRNMIRRRMTLQHLLGITSTEKILISIKMGLTLKNLILRELFTIMFFQEKYNLKKVKIEITFYSIIYFSVQWLFQMAFDDLRRLGSMLWSWPVWIYRHQGVVFISVDE